MICVSLRVWALSSDNTVVTLIILIVLVLAEFAHQFIFLLPGAIFDNSVSGVSVLHNVDNLSDHEPIVLKLSLAVKHIGHSHCVHVPRASCVMWPPPTDTDCLKTSIALFISLLNRIIFPVNTLFCTDLSCHHGTLRTSKHWICTPKMSLMLV